MVPIRAAVGGYRRARQLLCGLHHDAPFSGMRDEKWDSVLNVDPYGFYNVLRPLW